MRVLVAVKRVLDHNVKVQLRADGTGADLSNLKMSINPFDEIAVEEALRLKEAGHASEVIVVSIGTAKSEETLRAALAMGADRAILIKTDADLEPLAIAKVLAFTAKAEGADLILTGKQAIDDDACQTGQMLSALLDCALATFVSKVAVTEGGLHVICEGDGGQQEIALDLPAVLSADLRLNEPRYATLPNIMKAKKRPLDLYDLDALGLALTPRVRLVTAEAPPRRQAGQRLTSLEALQDVIREHAPA